MRKLPLRMRWMFFKLAVREMLCRRFGHKLTVSTKKVRAFVDMTDVEVPCKTEECARCRKAFVTTVKGAAPAGSWLRFAYDVEVSDAS